MPPENLTAEQFVERRAELPDGGRWTELDAGSMVTFTPPEPEHGTALLNLSKNLAAAVSPAEPGYACFDLSLVITRRPDTVRCPAISYFAGGPLFAESDNTLSEKCPDLVVEIASSNDRRRNLANRVERYLKWGVRCVWVLDTHAKQVYVFQPSRQTERLASHQTLFGSPVVPAFRMPVGDLFREPSWWKT